MEGTLDGRRRKAGGEGRRDQRNVLGNGNRSPQPRNTTPGISVPALLRRGQFPRKDKQTKATQIICSGPCVLVLVWLYISLGQIEQKRQLAESLFGGSSPNTYYILWSLCFFLTFSRSFMVQLSRERASTNTPPCSNAEEQRKERTDTSQGLQPLTSQLPTPLTYDQSELNRGERLILWLDISFLPSLLAVTAKERVVEASDGSSRKKWKTCFNSMSVFKYVLKSFKHI